MKSSRIISGICALVMSASMLAVSASAFEYPDIKTYDPVQGKYVSSLPVDGDSAYLPVRSTVDISQFENANKIGNVYGYHYRSRVKVALSATEVVYSGKEKKPSVAVRFGTELLKKGKDYTVEYFNNVEPGTATVAITGKGRYTGTYCETFYIVPKKVELKIKNYKSNEKGKVFWKADKYADGYQVQITTDSGFNKYIRSYDVKNVGGVVDQLKAYNMQRDTDYYIRVRAYIVDAKGDRHYGNWSSKSRQRRRGCVCCCWKIK